LGVLTTVAASSPAQELVPTEFRWTSVNVIIVPDTSWGVGVLLVTPQQPSVPALFHDQRFVPAEVDTWIAGAESLLTSGSREAGAHPVTMTARDSSMLVLAWDPASDGKSLHTLLAYYPRPDTGDPKPLIIRLDTGDARAFLDTLRVKTSESHFRPDTSHAGVLPVGLTQEKPQVLSMPSLTYPSDLRAHAVQGTVLAQMIVDTTGRVEPASYRTIVSPDPAFTTAARECLLRARFRPARVNHQPVRVLIEIPVSFTLRSHRS
jgi:TonB family protein